MMKMETILVSMTNLEIKILKTKMMMFSMTKKKKRIMMRLLMTKKKYRVKAK